MANAGQADTAHWWDVLAGDKNGDGRTIDGSTFPVLHEIRNRGTREARVGTATSLTRDRMRRPTTDQAGDLGTGRSAARGEGCPVTLVNSHDGDAGSLLAFIEEGARATSDKGARRHVYVLTCYFDRDGRESDSSMFEQGGRRRSRFDRRR